MDDQLNFSGQGGHMDRQLNIDFSIVNTDMAVRSMRDSGYKSTVHALAELVDNSIEAGATTIEIIGVSRIDSSTHRNTLQELAVLDNGNGMDEITLRRSLRYGDGTRSQRVGIGRFGLGLPNSSMSQARRVDVWSWQSGSPNALHTHLAIDDVEEGARDIPKPTRRPLPAVYMKGSIQQFGDSGTLVVWSDLDRVQWKRIATTFKHTEAFLGRVYRRFLAPRTERLHVNDTRSDEIGPRRTIVCVPVDDHDGRIVTSQDIVEVRPNDPLYLMTTTSCPTKFGDGPMFQEYEGSPFVVPVTVDGIEYPIRVRASYVRPEARDPNHERANWPEQYRGGIDAGKTLWGQHAGTNIGISVMRAHRELDIDESWTIRYDPTERWWKIEVDFPTALDELFGVTNNKQGTMTFQRLAYFDWEKERLDGEVSPGDVRRRMEREGDPRAGLLELEKQIKRTIKVLRARVKQSRRKRKRAKQQDESTNAKVTAVIKRRQSEGYSGRSKTLGDELPTKDEKRNVQRDLLVKKYKYTEDDALNLIEENFRTGHLVRWLVTEQQTSAFFDVDILPHVLEVALNSRHPVHKYLYEILDSGETDIEELDEAELRERLAKASVAFQILIYAWARYEDEQPERVRERLIDIRVEWGKYAREFFAEDDRELPPTSLGH